MKPNSKHSRRVFLVLPALLLGASGTVLAAASQQWEQNASGLGVAYAGSAAVADNASNQFFNPAGISQLPGIQLSLGGVGLRSSYEYRSSDGISSGGDAGGWTYAPNAYLSWQVTPAWSFGLGVSVPFAQKTDYDSDWLGNGLAIRSELDTVNINPAFAYRLSDKVALGFGLNFQTIDVDLSNAAMRFKADDQAMGWNAGALFTLSPTMRVGMSYRSAIDYTLSGKVDGVSSAEADLKLPDTFIVSVWQQLSDRWEAMGDLSYTRWNTVDDLRVVSRGNGNLLAYEHYSYENAWRVAWGAAYKLDDRSKLKFGLAYDRTPVTNTDRGPRMPDNDRIWLSFGGQWRMAHYGTIDLGYAYLYMKDAREDQAPSGKYDASGHRLGIQYSVGF